MVELPPGYRFYPTEEELVSFYLRHKLDGRRPGDIGRVIPVVDVCSLDPWQLPEVHRGNARAGDGEPWFYFCPRQEREAHGGRPSRTTPSGYWKAAGTPGLVYSTAGGPPIGTKKTMVFYRGRAPAGTKTKWKMNEYRALDNGDVDAASAPAPLADHATGPAIYPALQARSEFSLFRLYTSSGCPRQFDRRPCTAAAAGDSVEPASSSAAASPANDDVDLQRGQKRKTLAPNDGTSSSTGDHSMQQLQIQTQAHGNGSGNAELNENIIDWVEFLDWF